jgi:hypothetical protein
MFPSWIHSTLTPATPLAPTLIPARLVEHLDKPQRLQSRSTMVFHGQLFDLPSLRRALHYRLHSGRYDPSYANHGTNPQGAVTPVSQDGLRIFRKRFHSIHYTSFFMDTSTTANEYAPAYSVTLAVPYYTPLTQHTSNDIEIYMSHLHAFEAAPQSGPTAYTPNEKRIIVDSGASVTLSPHKEDFIGSITPCQPTTVKGIGSGLAIKGIGTVRYITPCGVDIRVQAIYVPDCPVCLLSPQQLAADLQAQFIIEPASDYEGARCTLAFPHKYVIQDDTMSCSHSPDTLHTVHLPIDPKLNLPVLFTAPGVNSYTSLDSPELDIQAAVAAFNNNTKQSILHKPSASAPHQATNVLSSPTTASRLTAKQRRTLQLHERLGHMDFQRLAEMHTAGVINDDICHSDFPVCRTCLEAKARRKPAGKSSLRSETKPGALASIDQLEAGYDGLKLTSQGRATTKRWRVATVFVDSATRFIYVHFQHSTSGNETLAAKHAYEAICRQHGRTLEAIHTDHGIFDKAVFATDTKAQNQRHTFSGVGAHWQNALAERTIGTITSYARAMLTHAMRNWPEVITAEFWPFALQQAVNILNCTPTGPASKSPYEVFANRSPPLHPSDFRVFGCPTYVLDASRQTGDHKHKWITRARLGAYVGHSQVHAGNVHLVFNPQTMHTSPQFHCMLDDGFLSLPFLASGVEELAAEKLSHLWTDSHDAWKTEHCQQDPTYTFFDEFWDLAPAPNHTADSGSKRPATAAAPPPQTNTKDPRPPSDSQLPEHSFPNSQPPSKAPAIAATANTPLHEGATTSPHEGVTHPALSSQAYPMATTKHAAGELRQLGSSTSEGAKGTPYQHHSQSVCITSDKFEPRSLMPDSSRSTKTLQVTHIKPSPESLCQSDTVFAHLLRSYKLEHGITGADNILHTPQRSFNGELCTAPHNKGKRRLSTLPKAASKPSVDFCPFQHVQNEALFAGLEPHVLAAKLTAPGAGNEDTLTRSQMHRAHDKDKFLAAEVTECNGLRDSNVFKVRLRSDIPANTQIIKTVWSYRRKRSVTGELLKHKARLCIDGSREKPGIHFDKTFAPVVQWSTVRLLLFLSHLCGLKSRQIDFVQAFCQAPVDRDLFIEIPDAWGRISAVEDNSNYVLQLQRNLYGSRAAARNWWLHLRQGLLDRGFHQCEHEPCMFIHKQCILICWVDDCCLFGPSDSAIDQILKDLSTSFIIEDEGDIQDFLGVRVSPNSDGKLSFTQTGLIDSILRQLDLDTTPAEQRDAAADQSMTQSNRATKYQTKTHDTPANGITYADSNGLDRQELWNYRSVIGKLIYLASSTRPDISFAVHQCARYSINPKASHEAAVKRIGRYLLKTRDKGITAKPDPSGSLFAHVDADFAGRWHKNHSELRENVLSRTGFVVSFCGCPIYWKSTLQTEIALSSTESEYMALSHCMREVLPLRRLLIELSEHSFIKDIPLTNNVTLLNGTIKPTEIFEDNAGCIVIATGDTYSARTRHISAKYHRLRDEIKNGSITILKIATSQNLADIFTKPLSREAFERLRFLLLGW